MRLIPRAESSDLRSVQLQLYQSVDIEWHLVTETNDVARIRLDNEVSSIPKFRRRIRQGGQSQRDVSVQLQLTDSIFQLLWINLSSLRFTSDVAGYWLEMQRTLVSTTTKTSLRKRSMSIINYDTNDTSTSRRRRKRKKWRRRRRWRKLWQVRHRTKTTPRKINMFTIKYNANEPSLSELAPLRRWCNLEQKCFG